MVATVNAAVVSVSDADDPGRGRRRLVQAVVDPRGVVYPFKGERTNRSGVPVEAKTLFRRVLSVDDESKGPSGDVSASDWLTVGMAQGVKRVPAAKRFRAGGPRPSPGRRPSRRRAVFVFSVGARERGRWTKLGNDAEAIEDAFGLVCDELGVLPSSLLEGLGGRGRPSKGEAERRDKLRNALAVVVAELRGCGATHAAVGEFLGLSRQRVCELEQRGRRLDLLVA
jgi:hypothetical protein